MLIRCTTLACTRDAARGVRLHGLAIHSLTLGGHTTCSAIPFFVISGVLTAEPFAPGTRGFGVLGLPPTAAPEPKVDVASLTPREVQSLARDPAVRGLALGSGHL